MNNLTNTSLTPATAQAFSSSKAVAGRKEKDTGNSLPVTQTSVKSEPQENATKPESQVSKTPPDRETVAAAVAQINDFTQQIQRNLQFNLDEDSGRVVVTVVDRESREVIRQIPNETVLSLARSLKDQQDQEQAQLIQPGDGKQLPPDVFNLIDAQA